MSEFKEYPKCVYKSREDYKIVYDIEEEQDKVKLGYGDFHIIILGRKPEGIDDKPKDETKPVENEDLLKVYEKETGKSPYWRNEITTKHYKEWLEKRK